MHALKFWAEKHPRLWHLNDKQESVLHCYISTVKSSPHPYYPLLAPLSGTGNAHLSSCTGTFAFASSFERGQKKFLLAEKFFCFSAPTLALESHILLNVWSPDSGLCNFIKEEFLVSAETGASQASQDTQDNSLQVRFGKVYHVDCWATWIRSGWPNLSSF